MQYTMVNIHDEHVEDDQRQGVRRSSLFPEEDARNKAEADGRRAAELARFESLERLLIAQQKAQIDEGKTKAHDRSDAVDTLNAAIEAQDEREKLAEFETLKLIAEQKCLERNSTKSATNKIKQALNPSHEPKGPIEFKDACGRRFRFPWTLCKTWKVCRLVI